jgi:Flp pilus assembly protein TadG
MTTRKRTGRRRRRGSGQTLTEFALILPLLILFLVAIFDVGRIVFVYNSVTNGAREGARLAIVNQFAASVKQRAIDQVAIAEVAAPNVVVKFYQPQPNTADPTQNATCGNNGVWTPTRPIAAGCVAVVTFETTITPITPIIKNILFSNGVTLKARSVLPVEYSCPDNDVVTSPANCPKQP